MCAHVLKQVPRRKLRGNALKCVKCGRFVSMTPQLKAASQSL